MIRRIRFPNCPNGGVHLWLIKAEGTWHMPCYVCHNTFIVMNHRYGLPYIQRQDAYGIINPI